MTDHYDDSESTKKPTFADALQELRSDHSNLPGPAVLYGLSGLSSDEIAQLVPVWQELDPTYRRVLMQMLVDVSEANFELNYDSIGYANLTDPQPEIRQAAIELLWESEDLSFMRQLVDIVRNDPSDEVRAEAVRALGRFVLMGELDEAPASEIVPIQELLLSIHNNTKEPLDVRRYALESIANCTRDDLAKIISSAYRNPNFELKIGSLVAMGRTCDSRWENMILDELESSNDELRLEAIRAAGELQLAEAVTPIAKAMIDCPPDELEVAIWALGEIGGKEAMRILEALLEKAEEDEDDDLLELIDDAIGSASIAIGDFGMLDFSEFDDELN